MRKPSVVALAAGLMSCATAVAQPTTLNFELRSNLLVVPVQLNGERVPFVVDTGASVTVVTPAAANSAGLETVGRVSGAGVGGDVSMEQAVIGRLTIGSSVFDDLTCVVMPLDQVLAAVGEDVGGVIGYDVLSRHRVTIDYRVRSITLERYADSPAPAPGRIEGDRFTLAEPTLSFLRPDDGWRFQIENELPEIHVRLAHQDLGMITFRRLALAGVDLERMGPIIERSLSLSIEGFGSGQRHLREVDGKPALVLSYTGSIDEAPVCGEMWVLGDDSGFWLIDGAGAPAVSSERNAALGRIMQSITVVPAPPTGG